MHVVWDWNGTLLDDLTLVIDSVNHAVKRFDAGPFDVEDYRSHYTRPVKLFYEKLLERPLAEADWHRLDDDFHDAYRQGLPDALLAEDAHEALQEVAEADHTGQSLLSMFWHDELVPAVRRRGIDSYFSRIDGLRGERGPSKTQYLLEHLSVQDVSPFSTVLIGDALDDAAAAHEVGAQAILYHGGSHFRAELEEVGVPVVDSLIEAVSLAVG